MKTPPSIHPAPSRRHVLKTGIAACASSLGFPAITRSQSPNSKIHLAFIGVGGRGAGNVKEITAGGDPVVALCDVNSINLDFAAQKFPGARKFRDFRKLYENLGDVDAVVVSTTEHTHAYATLPALKAGKPVYCEKPLTHNIAEARLITEAAAKAGVPTQMGTQIHGMSNYRRVVELVRSGVIGDVTDAHVWVSRAWGLQSAEDAEKNQDRIHVTERPKEAQSPPPYLDWDLWLGPAPERPFNEVYFPGPLWYRWWDFGSGTMSDLGSHWNDLPFWALDLDAPVAIQAFGPEPHLEIAPASMSATYEYAARGKRPAVKVHWHQGDKKPDIWHENPAIQAWSNGALFIGSKGMILSDYKKHILLPEADFTDFTPPEPTIADSPGHHAEWLHAIRNGTPTGSPFSYAGPLTEANHLGNVAYRTGKKILWDSANMKVTNEPGADRFIRRVPRSGWDLI